MTLAEMKQYVVEHVAAVGAEVDGALSHTLENFVEWVDHKQAVADATAFLQRDGYTVTPPQNQQ